MPTLSRCSSLSYHIQVSTRQLDRNKKLIIHFVNRKSQTHPMLSGFKRMQRFYLSRRPRRFWILTLNKRARPTELPSLWGTRVHAESLLMMHPE